MPSRLFSGILRREVNRKLVRLILLIMSSIIALGALVMPIAIRPSGLPLQVGSVSTVDVQAPHALTYESQALTDEARRKAENAIQPVYLPADPAIARRQIERLHVALAYIATVRQDKFSTLEQKIADIQQISDMQLTSEVAAQVLALNDNRWADLEAECLNVLEQVMRTSIRSDQILEAQRRIPTLIRFSFPQDQAGLVTALVEPFVAANSLYSQELTNKARKDAAAAVEPVTRSYVAGEIIVQRGQVITPDVLEALQKYNLLAQEDPEEELLASLAIVITSAVLIGLYFSRRNVAPINDFRGLLIIVIIFMIFLYSARLIIPNRTVVPYIFPLAAFGLTMATIYGLEVGMLFTLVLSLLTAFGLSNSLDLTIFYTLSSMCGILILGKGRRVASFFWAGIAIGICGSAIIIAYRLPGQITDWIGIATLVGSAFINGIAAASLTLLLQYLLAQLLGLTTALQLMDLQRPDHPLVQFIIRNAPGTYQHSLQVANLAEQAADAIGADALLTRVGAIYHDAGKAVNPSFFIENQVPGNMNPHDDMDPPASASIIIRHVTDGVELARKFRLPPRIQDFVREHHGTLITRYQYTQAVQAAGNQPDLVNKDLFRYPGPRPQSKETALLMLADGCEARARAELPKNDDELRTVVRKVIDFCQKEGQLDDTRLTLRDLSTITDVFVKILKNTYHPRIKYPDLRPASSVAATEKSITVESERIHSAPKKGSAPE